MKKNIVMIFVISLLIFCQTIKVNATSLYVDSLAEEEDGIKYLNINSVDPDLILADGRCDISYQDILADDNNAWLHDLSQEDLIEIATQMSKNCVIDTYEAILGFYCKSNNACQDGRPGGEYTDKNHIRINEEDYVIRYQITESTPKITSNHEILNNFQEEYSLWGFDAISDLYNYGSIHSSFSNSDLFAYRFKEYKETLNKYNSYDLSLLPYNGGGAPDCAEINAYIGIFEDNILYDIKHIEFSTSMVFLVDKDAPGTWDEKTIKRIREYFNNDEITIELDMDTYEEYIDDYSDNFNKFVEKVLNLDSYTANVVTLTIEEYQSPILVLEVDKSLLDVLDIKIKDYNNNNIAVDTESYDVPLDANLITKDVTNETYVKNFIENNNYELDAIFDIKLISEISGAYIEEIVNGLNIYIPTNKYKVGDIVDIYYIKEDGTKGETIEGEIVKIDNTLYAKFMTNHLSTYAIGESLNNPNTSDNIIIYLLISIISATAILINYKKYRNN